MPGKSNRRKKHETQNVKKFYYLFWANEPVFLMIPNMQSRFLYAIGCSSLEKAEELLEKVKDIPIFKKYNQIRAVDMEIWKEYQDIMENSHNMQLEIGLDPSPEILHGLLTKSLDIKNAKFTDHTALNITLEQAIKECIEQGYIKKIWIDQNNNIRYEFTEKGQKEMERAFKSNREADRYIRSLIKKGIIKAIGQNDEGTVYQFTEKYQGEQKPPKDAKPFPT